MMNKLVLSPPLFGFIVGTRAALGMGIGLLLADRFTRGRRRAIGATLLALGAATTVPAAMALMSRKREAGHREAADVIAEWEGR